MKNPVAMVGIGEMGGVFARGLLKNGHPVYPVTRDMKLADLSDEIGQLESVIVAVGEKDLQPVLTDLPKDCYGKCVLLQNELLPADWEQHGIQEPTVISVWFEKKQPKDYKVIIPSPVYGPQAQLIADSLGAINIPTKVLASADELLFELILKNLYIVTTNVAGLKVGGNVGELWSQHRDFANQVANEVLDIQFALAKKEFDRDQLIAEMVKAFEGDLEHKCMGRSAPGRLQRALSQAEEHGLSVSTLKDIQAVAAA